MINSFGHYVHFGHSKGCFMPKTLPETSMPETLHTLVKCNAKQIDWATIDFLVYSLLYPVTRVSETPTERTTSETKLLIWKAIGEALKYEIMWWINKH